jgi:hypothetical protein
MSSRNWMVMFPMLVSSRTLLLLGIFSFELSLPNMLYATMITATAANKATIDTIFLVLLFFLRGRRLRDLLRLITNVYDSR